MRHRFGSRMMIVALATTLALSTALAGAEDPPLAVKLEPKIMLTPSAHARLQAAADQGIDALRRYIWRTRMIYNYRLSDLV